MTRDSPTLARRAETRSKARALPSGGGAVGNRPSLMTVLDTLQTRQDGRTDWLSNAARGIREEDGRVAEMRRQYETLPEFEHMDELSSIRRKGEVE